MYMWSFSSCVFTWSLLCACAGLVSPSSVNLTDVCHVTTTTIKDRTTPSPQKFLSPCSLPISCPQPLIYFLLHDFFNFVLSKIYNWRLTLHSLLSPVLSLASAFEIRPCCCGSQGFVHVHCRVSPLRGCGTVWSSIRRPNDVWVVSSFW